MLRRCRGTSTDIDGLPRVMAALLSNLVTVLAADFCLVRELVRHKEAASTSTSMSTMKIESFLLADILSGPCSLLAENLLRYSSGQSIRR